MSFYSPLRYPGGKSILSKWFEEIINKNFLNSYVYVEPYAGGAGAGLYLLSKGIVNNIIINDYDKRVYGFWYSILNNTEKFIKEIEKTPVNIEVWEKQKEIIKTPEKFSFFEIGFAFFYLNRTNVSGIVKGGPIGGRAQKGKYKIDVRFNKQKLIEKIKHIAFLKNKIKLVNMDALELLKGAQREFFLYLDPPYFNKGNQLYMNFYKSSDHEKIAKELKKLSNPWVLTYDNEEYIKNLYDWCKGYEYSLRYYAAKKHIATELVFYNNLEYFAKPDIRK
jgi:DNA adenine methylase